MTAEINIEKVAIALISELIAKFLPSKRALLPDSGRLSDDIQFRALIDNLLIEGGRLQLSNPDL